VLGDDVHMAAYMAIMAAVGIESSVASSAWRNVEAKKLNNEMKPWPMK